jgi:hypothetical protein
VLCVVGAVVLLIGGCMTTCVYLGWRASKHMKEYSSEAEKNPQVAALDFAASVNPNLEVLSKDVAAGKITIKNKQTGEVVTFDLSAKNVEEMRKAMEQFAKGMKASPPVESKTEAAEQPSPAAEDQHTAGNPAEQSAAPVTAAETGESSDVVAIYPGAKTLSNAVNSIGGNSIGNYTFLTGDAPGTVADFYQKKFTGGGFSVLSRQNGSDGNGAIASMLASRADPQTMITFVAKTGEGGTRVVIGYTRAGGN